jgi:ribonuclease P protein component
MKAKLVLTRRRDFSLTLEKGDSQVGRLVVMKALVNGLAVARYGLVASKKVGNAVIRNQARRRLREILSKLELKPGWDIVIIVRRAMAVARYGDIDKEIRMLLAKGRLILENNEEDRSGFN